LAIRQLCRLIRRKAYPALYAVIGVMYMGFFFFSSRRRHTRWPRDWSSDVCSSDLLLHLEVAQAEATRDLEVKKAQYNELVKRQRSEERRVGKECRSRWATDQ